MFRRDLLASMPAFLIPTKVEPERRLQRISRNPEQDPKGDDQHITSCYEIKPVAITVCDEDVVEGQAVRHRCKDGVVVVGTALTPAKAGKPVMILMPVDLNHFDE